MIVAKTKITHSTKRPKAVFSIDVGSGSVVSASLGGEIRLWNEREELVRTSKRHSGTVLCVRYSTDGCYFASGADDGTVIVFRADGTLVRSMKEHSSDVSNVLWTDMHLVSVGYDGYVVFYSLEGFSVLKKAKVHEGPIKGIAADPAFTCICTQGDDGIALYEGMEVVRRIPASEGTILESFFSRMSWSPDGRFFAAGLSFNRKYDTVEIFNRDLRSEYSLIGHVAPCEVVAFNPNVYMDERRYYILAVASQDLSLSFWSSLSARPLLLIKNFLSLPALDMRWNKDGSELYVCSYGGEVKKVVVEPGDFGRVMEGEECDWTAEIFFTKENARMFAEAEERRKKRSEEDREMAEKEMGEVSAAEGGSYPSVDARPLPPKKQKKAIRPVLLDESPSGGFEIDTGHSQVFIFGQGRSKEIEQRKAEPFSREFGDFRVSLSEDRSCVSVKRGGADFYQVVGDVRLMCVSKRYLCVYTGKIQLYDLRTGVLVLPFMCVDDVASLDVLGGRLAVLERDGGFMIISLRKRKKVVEGRIPRREGFLSLCLSRKYFLVSRYNDGEMFFDALSGLWYLKTPGYNSIYATDTDYNKERDETLEQMENKFRMEQIAGNHGKMLRHARRMVEMARRAKSTDDCLENKLLAVLKDLVYVGKKRNVIFMLQELNDNFVFQPFVVHAFKAIGEM
jgi:protein HIRA/HIR1